MNIEGIERTDWRFYFFSIDDNHIVSIALGPTRDVTLTYRESAWAATKSADVTNSRRANNLYRDHIEEIDSASSQYENVLQFRLPPIRYTKISDMLRSDIITAWNDFQHGGDNTEDVQMVVSSSESTTCADIFCGCTGAMML